ncbi:calcium-binding mitochondrial carrier protein SCaMC-2-like isoform X2 [Leptotrombidium deliense]|uniref:Calcium-binding mitochondrial carrier protein SCaMC-2-like isoform X2 n=1 Tax=Leptotrombidium deliense TaxID=299467 RepID=A0A443SJ89_9ACAR|nr:calcium-binding mitochondrial carrier protein SCaMC-2-like isoform X2 [Leptotrombidium deliense]
MDIFTKILLLVIFLTKPEKKVETVFYKNLIAGALGGTISRTITAPIDRIKVYRQVTGFKFNSIYALVRYLYREGGVLSFWRGNYVNVLKFATESALKFTLYEEVKQTIKTDKNVKLSNVERFLAASITGALSQTLLYPLDTMKLKMVISKTGEYSSLFQEIKSNFEDGGIRVFYRGYLVNLLGVIPFYGIELSFYEFLKVLYRDYMEDETTVSRLVCAGISTSVAQFTVYPLAIVRARRQAVAADKQVKSLKTMVISIYKKSGIRTFYAGIVPSMLRGVPATAINYVAYEHIRSAFGIQMS